MPEHAEQQPAADADKGQARDGDDERNTEPIRAVIAVHPAGTAVALAAGSELRVYDKAVSQLHLLSSGGESPTAAATAFRSVAFSRCGRFVAAGGDDKTASVWSCATWSRIKTIKSPKKISAVSFTSDGSAMLAANKFGDVLVTSTEGQPPLCELFLGHYCSVLTSLSLNRDGTLLATTDRDAKVRVSVVPSTPLEGAPEIQSYCFGHTEFVSWSTFVQQGEVEVLVTGGGDGTLRLWDPRAGRELCVLGVGKKELAEEEERNAMPVLAGCVSQDGRFLVVGLDGEAELRVVRVDAAGGTMTECGRYAVPSLPMATDMCCDSDGVLWVTCGPLPPGDGGVEEAGAGVVVCAVMDDKGGLKEVEPPGLLNEAKQQLQRCDCSAAALERLFEPHKLLPRYLFKRTFSPDAAKKEFGGRLKKARQ